MTEQNTTTLLPRGVDLANFDQAIAKFRACWAMKTS